ncbi:MAG: hypothetical protein IMZ71_04800 [Chloroflexi bacterium]|nr:hypothetical protein [Chloroflexota bacterium]
MTRPRTFEGTIDGVRVEAEFSDAGADLIIHAVKVVGPGAAMNDFLYEAAMPKIKAAIRTAEKETR